MVATFTIEAEILVYIEKERVCVLFLRTICFSNSGKPQLAPPSLPDALILQLLCHTTTGKIECGRHNQCTEIFWRIFEFDYKLPPNVSPKDFCCAAIVDLLKSFPVPHTLNPKESALTETHK
jgi:hypothetical protein